MKNEIYIGKNGIGKSVELEEIYKKYNKTSLLIKYSMKENAPDTTIMNKSNKLLNDFEDFLDELFTFKVNFKLNKEYQESFLKFKKRVKTNEELKEIWEKMLDNDKDLNFIAEKSIPKIIISNKDDDNFEITKKMYTFDFDKWKDKTKAGMKSYGTGKLAYFQIKFIYSHLDLIEPNQDKFLIVDEPELFLHNSLKRKIGYMLKEIGKKVNVIVASHSPKVLSSFYDPSNTTIFSKKEHSEKEWREISFKNPYVFTSLLECFNALMADKIFVVEGGNDYKLIEYILNSNDRFLNSNVDIVISRGKAKINSQINILINIRYDNEIIKNEKLFSKNDVYVLYDQDSSKQDKNFIFSNGEAMTHASINKEIDSNNNSNYKKSFNENLETYFGIAKNEKSEWDPSTFFGKDENKEKLEKFIQEFEMEDFLNSQID